jgi:ribonuclease P protein component
MLTSANVPPSPLDEQRPLTVNRSTTLRGNKELEEFFQKRHNLYLPRTEKPPCIKAAWAEREWKEGSSTLLFLISVSKKNVRKAHDRNKIKRWMKSALQKDPMLKTITELERDRKRQLTLMFAGLRGPSSECTYTTVQSEIEKYLKILQKKLKVVSNPS